MQLCFASNNLHKIQEVKSILGSGYSILSLQEIGCTEELLEEQDTIPGNSFQKANYVFTKYGIACFADDSGLEVSALHGRPGVDSAHYAGPQRSHDDNINLLLANLKDYKNRSAQFRTVITLITSTINKQFEGILKGEIIREKRGVGGFGYDPIFLPEESAKTLAEMSMEEKNNSSHRAMAIQKLVKFLQTK
jgi:XTP/dITP diphosphohydrolase